jgi:uncharacterized protein DUF1761
MPSVHINWLALVVAALINMVIGSLWYSKAGFGKPWAKVTGRHPGEMGGGNWAYAITTVGSLLQAWILLHFVRYAGALSFPRGAEIGFFLWLGFVAITSLVHHTFEDRPWRLWQINAGYFLVVLLINGGLLAVWR